VKGKKKEKEKRCGVRDEKTRGSKNNCMGTTWHSRILQVMLLIICQFHDLVTCQSMYFIGLIGAHGRRKRCKASGAFDYMSI